jgi:phosphatidylglycerophosphate synthase
MRKNRSTGASRRSLSGDILSSILSVLVIVTALAIILQRMLELSELFPWKVIAAFLVVASLTFIFALRHLPSQFFGPANRATLARGALVALLCSLIGETTVPWLVALVASAVLVLDGLDGWLARRFGVASDFGARFDMETDAVLLLALAGLAWQYHKAGSWIMLAGLMRYLFVASSRLFPPLRRPLPPRRRRQTAFVFQAIALIACISPVFSQPLSSSVALLGLAVLSSSFAIDIVYLARDGANLVRQSQA